MVALAIDFSIFSIIHSWGTVSWDGSFAELVSDMCASVWIKLLSLTGKHSKLSFIFLKNKQKTLYLYICLAPIDPWFYISKYQKTQYLNTKTCLTWIFTHIHTNSPLFAAIHVQHHYLEDHFFCSLSHDSPWGSYFS